MGKLYPTPELALLGLAPSSTRFMTPLDNCLVERSAGRSWLLTTWEPLRTKAPSPSLAQPYCCYIDTVIFYHRPYISRPARPWRDRSGRLRRGQGKDFVEWDRVVTRMAINDLVAFQGTVFEITNGTVVWWRKGWWMRHDARRVQPPAHSALMRDLCSSAA